MILENVGKSNRISWSELKVFSLLLTLGHRFLASKWLNILDISFAIKIMIITQYPWKHCKIIWNIPLLKR